MSYTQTYADFWDISINYNLLTVQSHTFQPRISTYNIVLGTYSDPPHALTRQVRLVKGDNFHHPLILTVFWQNWQRYIYYKIRIFFAYLVNKHHNITISILCNAISLHFCRRNWNSISFTFDICSYLFISYSVTMDCGSMFLIQHDILCCLNCIDS